MRELVIDLSFVKSKDEIHEILASWLEFPKYYGKNLDALFECLCEINSQTIVIFKQFDDFKTRFNQYANDFILCFKDAVCQNENIKFEIRQ